MEQILKYGTTEIKISSNQPPQQLINGEWVDIAYEPLPDECLSPDEIIITRKDQHYYDPITNTESSEKTN